MRSITFTENSFLKSQLKFERVKVAYNEKWLHLSERLLILGYTHRFEMLIRAYKAEGKLEVWLKKSTAQGFNLFKTYDFCKKSGSLGPKITEGDLQTPEGLYKVSIFNPKSSYHLSLGLNYPNQVDVFRTGPNRNPGSDIYIHGGCFTVGCIPIQDDQIKELYLLAISASNARRAKIPVHIFPFRMTDMKMKKYLIQNPTQVTFWQMLQQVYIDFEKNKMALKIKEVKGSYVVK